MSWPAYWDRLAFIAGVVRAGPAGMVICWALSWSCTLDVANAEAHTSSPPATRRTAATTMPVQEMSLSNELRMVVWVPSERPGGGGPVVFCLHLQRTTTCSS